VLLADLLDQAAPEDFPERFKYTALRRDRTARVHALALDSIRMWHPAGQAAAARNARMSAMTATDLHDFLAWMHEPQSLTRV
jgi:salicylate hydroxylase